MDRDPHPKEALFNDALALPPAERASFLAQACGTDVALLAELIALLAAHEEPESLTSAHLLTRAAPAPDEKPSDWIGLSAVGLARAGRYRLLQKIGEGGCGVVWMAEQEEPVRRRIALKVIKLGMDTKAVIARFEAERQALAMMDHPHIAKVHDAGSTDNGRPYFVMELVRGIPITKYCDEQQLAPVARLELFIKVCQAVQHAHQKGIIHRDLKPSNILVTVNDGQATPKVIDFGIAKATQGRLTDATLFTAFEQFIGTPAYMSPEQAEMSSLDIDTRSDIYSLGVLLYELLTGRQPFDPKRFAGAGVDHIRQQIRESEPPRPSARWRTLAEAEQTTVARQRGTLPAQLSGLLRGDLDWIVMRCLEKDRTRRYETANGLAMDIQRHLRNEPVVARPPSTAYLLQKLVRRHRFGFAAAGSVLAVVVLGAITTAAQATRALRAERQQNELREAARQAQERETAAKLAAAEERQRAAQQRWAREHILPEINRLIVPNEAIPAFEKAVEAEKFLQDEPTLEALWPRISLTSSLESTPSGAEVYIKPYFQPGAEWRLLGRTPIKKVRLGRGTYRWQIRQDGYATIERARSPLAQEHYVMDQVADVPPGMLLVGFRSLPTSTLASTEAREGEKDASQAPDLFFIDRYEVTNQQYKEFMDRGGYASDRWWREPFRRDGRDVPWLEAMASFRDSTGHPGPATWSRGMYPPGEEGHPVTGISWFEAAAYAASVNKHLPTVWHWQKAASGKPGNTVQWSNFSGRGTAPVGTYRGMSTWGVYDVAGNAREWCWNEANPGQRYLMGGAFSDPIYMFNQTEAMSPWDRSAANGFRCMQTLPSEPMAPASIAPVVPSTRNSASVQPVNDEAFEVLRGIYAYLPSPLDPREERAAPDPGNWRSLRVSIKAAYGNERVPINLFLPKNRPGPYQAVIYFPGSSALTQRDRIAREDFCQYVVDSGRILVAPVYNGLYERGEGGRDKYIDDMNVFPDLVVQWSKDLRRTIDYLVTRPDLVEAGKLAYLGMSLGAAVGPVLTALEPRFRASVLLSGGLRPIPLPAQVDPVNFAPRVRAQTLMLNGIFDFTFPEPIQRTVLNLLRQGDDRKHDLKHFEQGHILSGEPVARAVNEWFDRHLGPVR